MGSDEFALQGWQHAAYQNIIFSIARDENDGVGVWADLTATDEAFTICYTINLTPSSSGGNRGTYIFSGSPEGATCHRARLDWTLLLFRSTKSQHGPKILVVGAAFRSGALLKRSRANHRPWSANQHLWTNSAFRRVLAEIAVP